MFASPRLRPCLFVAACLYALLVAPVTYAQDTDRSDPLAEYREKAMEKWDAEIRKLEALDTKQPDPERALLFIGSSSIRMWDTIAEDMQPWPVIQRGYGGAKFSDLAVFTERLVKPHKFDAVVIFVANDVTGGKEDKTVAEVVRLFEHVVSSIRKSAPEQPIFLVEITPTPSRFAAWNKIQEVNAALKESCAKGKNLHFITTAKEYLTADGQPMPELFKEDRLHQNRDGYRRWGKLIREQVSAVMKSR